MDKAFHMDGLGLIPTTPFGPVPQACQIWSLCVESRVGPKPNKVGPPNKKNYGILNINSGIK